MTKDEALRLALSTLDEVRQETFRLLRNGERLYAEDKVWSTIITIKEALAQPEQEPQIAINSEIVGYVTTQRTWVGLTDEDLQGICDEWQIYNGAWMNVFVGDIEAKLKERNT
jgi:hypothetical protein